MDDLYREIILDHYKNPRNFGTLKSPCARAEKDNPFCGDNITMEVTTAYNKKTKSHAIKEIAFTGKGCAISMASASLLTEHARDKSLEMLLRLTKDDIVNLLHTNISLTRLKCALLPLEVLKEVIGKT